MTETLIGYDIHASFDGANQFQAANVERRYRVTTDDGTYERRARGVVADLASVVPSSDLMEQVTALTSQLAEANAAKASTEASVSSLTAQLAAAQARIAELENPAPVIDGVPQRVTPYQARVALHRANLLTAVEAAVKAAVKAADGEAEIAWEYATTIERNSPFIAQLASIIGLDSAAVDALFVSAAAVT